MFNFDHFIYQTKSKAEYASPTNEVKLRIISKGLVKVGQ